MPNRKQETSERSDGNTITTLDNKLPIRIANGNENRGNVGDIRNNSPSNNTPVRTPQARSETKPMVIRPIQNLMLDEPINNRNWRNERNKRPNTSSSQPRNENRGNFPQTQTENRPVYQLPHKRPIEALPQPQPSQSLPINRSNRPI